MPENITLARNSTWGPVGAALVAEVLRGNGAGFRVRLRVHGESMLPALWPGSVVEIESCSLGDVRVGEIVLALREGRLFLHRLIACERNGFVLCGDSMPGPDPQYRAQALLGRVAEVDGKRVAFRPTLWSRLRAACSRAVGMVLCHCSIARRVALRLRVRRDAAAREFRIPSPAAEFNSAGRSAR